MTTETTDTPLPTRRLLLNLAWALVATDAALIALDVLDEETVRAAQQEIEAWRIHPHSFYAIASFLAAGRVA